MWKGIEDDGECPDRQVNSKALTQGTSHDAFILNKKLANVNWKVPLPLDLTWELFERKITENRF